VSRLQAQVAELQGKTEKAEARAAANYEQQAETLKAQNAKAASEIRALKVQLSRSEAALEEATRKTPFLQQLKAETATIRKQAKAEAEQQLQQAANIARTSKLEVDVLIRVAGTEWEALELAVERAHDEVAIAHRSSSSATEAVAPAPALEPARRGGPSSIAAPTSGYASRRSRSQDRSNSAESKQSDEQALEMSSWIRSQVMDADLLDGSNTSKLQKVPAAVPYSSIELDILRIMNDEAEDDANDDANDDGTSTDTPSAEKNIEGVVSPNRRLSSRLLAPRAWGVSRMHRSLSLTTNTNNIKRPGLGLSSICRSIMWVRSPGAGA